MNSSLRLIVPLLLALLASALPTSNGQNNSIGCFLPVECIGATNVGFTLAATANKCAVFCKSVPDCNYFTFYATQGDCLAEVDCPETNDQCTDCISGK